MTTIWIAVAAIAGGILLAALLIFTYLTIVIDADANRQDRVDSAPPIGPDGRPFLRALHGAGHHDSQVIGPESLIEISRLLCMGVICV